MSRRKQTKPHHWHSDSDNEEGPQDSEAKDPVITTPQSETADASSSATTTTTAISSSTTTTTEEALSSSIRDQKRLGVTASLKSKTANSATVEDTLSSVVDQQSSGTLVSSEIIQTTHATVESASSAGQRSLQATASSKSSRDTSRAVDSALSSSVRNTLSSILKTTELSSAGNKLSTEISSKQAVERTADTTFQDPKDVRRSADLSQYHASAANTSSDNAIRVPKKRGRPPSLPLQKTVTVSPASVTLSPRRQSLRLQQSQHREDTTGEGSSKKMSHRTCEYCGVVKPTPAALQRHLRKHTGERPFICQVCHKAYKAKRSLHLHQLSNHQELFDSANGLDLSNTGPAAVSANTTHLLRETLESRRLARMSEDAELDFSNADSVAAKEATEDSSDVEEAHGDAYILATGSPSSINNSTASLDHSGEGKGGNAEELEGEETGDEVSKRSCPYCFKVCLKPSDMKRHFMVHTGERPFLCQVCQKRFKQKGSLLYHQKAAHDLNVELSQGLEERYLRLKTRSAMRSLAVMDSLVLQESGSALLFPGPVGTSAGLDSKRDVSDFTSPSSHLAKESMSGLANDTDLHHRLSRQTSHTSDGSWADEIGSMSNIVEVDISEDFEFNSDPRAEGCHSRQQKSKRVAVRKEAILVTKLDGYCLSSGSETSLFRCYLCGKISASLHLMYSHLALHFDPKVTAFNPKVRAYDPNVETFDCKICQAAFPSRPEMADHLHAQHNLDLKDLDLDLSNNNHSKDMQHSSINEENPEASRLKYPRKGSLGMDDLNNNNDNHINKETTFAHSDGNVTPDLPSMKGTDVSEPGVMKEACGSEDVGLKNFAQWSFGTHNCTICRKGFTSQYLLMRHMHLHKQQLAIEAVKAAVYSGASSNGFHQDILLKPPAVLPQNSDRVDPENKALVKGKSPRKSTALDEVRGEKVKVSLEAKSCGRQEEGQEKVTKTDSDVESTKALLKKEGIKEDITVVLPSDPDMEERNEAGALKVAGSKPEVKVKEETEAEIRSAPKRSLMSFRKEGPPTKSRRKAALPTRINHERMSPNNDPPALRLYAMSPSPPPLQAAADSDHTSLSSPPLDGDESMSSVRSRSPEEGEEPAPERPSFDRDELLAQRAKYVQSLHAAFRGLPLPPALLANGFPPSSSLAMAAAGLFNPLVHAATGSVNSTSGSMRKGVNPYHSVPNAFPGLHGPASSTLLRGAPTSPSPHVSGEMEEQTQAEDLSVSSSSIVSPSDPLTPSRSATSPRTSSPNDHESLVGYPRVLWPHSGGGKSSRDTPSPSSQHSPPPTFTRNGKHLKRVFHTLTSEDMGNATTTDGRKVTSLSRTHSRLYVVNQPVDRERLCKPTVLPDGRTVYRCIFCHKDFLSYSDINRHMDFHEDIRPYKCNFCDYFARTNSQLKVHMMRHQGIREYCCRLCNYKGVTQSDLNRHMKSQIHLLKSRNECNRCGEGFVTTKNLEKHVSAVCTGKHKMDYEDEMLQESS